MEIWNSIIDYEGLYEVSNLGRVKSLPRNTTCGGILKGSINNSGYELIHLCKNNISKTVLVHRLVASAFLENPDNLPQVNHKNEFEKLNNCVDNLEWCTAIYNLNYGTAKERGRLTQSKPVLQLSITGELVKEWTSTKETGRNGYQQASVQRCCVGTQVQHSGYKWMYKEDNVNEL